MKAIRNILLVMLIAAMMLTMTACGTKAEVTLTGSDSSTNCSWSCSIADEAITTLSDTQLRRSATNFVLKGVAEGTTQATFEYVHKYTEGYIPRMTVYDIVVLKGKDVFATAHENYEFLGTACSATLLCGEKDDASWSYEIGDENVIQFKSQENKKADTSYTKEDLEKVEEITSIPYATTFNFVSVGEGETTITFTNASTGETFTRDVTVDADLSVVYNY